MSNVSNQWSTIFGRMAGVVALIVLVGGIYRPVLGFDFLLWDDEITATANPLMPAPWSWSTVADLFSADEALRFKPAHWAVCKAVHSVWGLNPGPWHAIGWGFHVLSAVLVFLTGARALRLAMPQAKANVVGAAGWLAALLWAVHPLRVEPVAWVTGSTYPMATCWLLASFWAYLRAAAATTVRRGTWLLVSWLLALLAYGTYPISVCYGAWLVVADCWLLTCAPVDKWRWRERAVRRWWGKHLLFVAPACGAVLATVVSRLRNPGIFPSALGLNELSLWDRACGAAASAFYLLARPFGSWDFSPNRYGFGGSLAPALPAACGFVAVLVIALVLRRRFPRGGALGLGWLALAVPCLGLTERFTWPVDRYSYLLDVVLWVGLGGLAVVAVERWRGGVLYAKVALVGGAVVVAVVWAQVGRGILPAWRESDAFFGQLAGRADFTTSWAQQAHIYKLWAVHLRDRGYPRASLWRLGQARALYHAQLVSALESGDLRRAVAMATKQEEAVGISVITRRERAAWNLELGNVGQAKAELEALRPLMPDDPRVQLLLFEAYKANP